MLWHPLVRAAPLLLAHLSLSSPVRSAPNATVPKPDADGKYTIEAPGIRAQFIPYGASLTNLFVNDSRGIERDVTLGFDNSTYYSLDKSHPHLGGVPGKFKGNRNKKNPPGKPEIHDTDQRPQADTQTASRTVCDSHAGRIGQTSLTKALQAHSQSMVRHLISCRMKMMAEIRSMVAPTAGTG